jgi:hypothetical protein
LSQLYSFAFVLALAFAGFFYKAGEQEIGSGLLWGGLSIVFSMAIIVTFNGGMLLVLLGQVALMIGIALVRVWLDGRG